MNAARHYRRGEKIASAATGGEPTNEHTYIVRLADNRDCVQRIIIRNVDKVWDLNQHRQSKRQYPGSKREQPNNHLLESTFEEGTQDPRYHSGLQYVEEHLTNWYASADPSPNSRMSAQKRKASNSDGDEVEILPTKTIELSEYENLKKQVVDRGRVIDLLVHKLKELDPDADLELPHGELPWKEKREEEERAIAKVHQEKAIEKMMGCLGKMLEQRGKKKKGGDDGIPNDMMWQVEKGAEKSD
jgi:hypothetical protein